MKINWPIIGPNDWIKKSLLTKLWPGDGKSEDAREEERVPEGSDTRRADSRDGRNEDQPADVRALQEEWRVIQSAADAERWWTHDDVLCLWALRSQVEGKLDLCFMILGVIGRSVDWELGVSHFYWHVTVISHSDSNIDPMSINWNFGNVVTSKQVYCFSQLLVTSNLLCNSMTLNDKISFRGNLLIDCPSPVLCYLFFW